MIQIRTTIDGNNFKNITYGTKYKSINPVCFFTVHYR